MISTGIQAKGTEERGGNNGCLHAFISLACSSGLLVAACFSRAAARLPCPARPCEASPGLSHLIHSSIRAALSYFDTKWHPGAPAPRMQGCDLNACAATCVATRLMQVSQQQQEGASCMTHRQIHVLRALAEAGVLLAQILVHLLVVVAAGQARPGYCQWACADGCCDGLLVRWVRACFLIAMHGVQAMASITLLGRHTCRHNNACAGMASYACCEDACEMRSCPEGCMYPTPPGPAGSSPTDLHVAAGLTHHPHGGTLHSLAAQGTQHQGVRGRGGLGDLPGGRGSSGLSHDCLTAGSLQMKEQAVDPGFRRFREGQKS